MTIYILMLLLFLEIGEVNMEKLLVFTTKKVIKSINFTNILKHNFVNGTFVLANSNLKILYNHNIKNFKEKDILKVGNCLSENSVGTNAVYMCKVRKTTTSITSNEHELNELKNVSSICSPIQKDNGEIVGFLGLFLENEITDIGMILLVEAISKLIYEKIMYLCLINHLKRIRHKDECNFSILTEKESLITKMVSKGKTDEEIAEELIISKSTVRAHIRSIFEKLQVNSKTDLVIQFYSYRINKVINGC